jgi:hypothetical protein
MHIWADVCRSRHPIAYCSSSVTHIFRSDLPSNRSDRKAFDVINVTCSLETLAFFLSSTW